jgi:hypothetical protein
VSDRESVIAGGELFGCRVQILSTKSTSMIA